MATLSGSYKETNVASLANMETLLVAHLTLEDTAVGVAALITGSLVINMLADDGAGATTNHKITQSLNCNLLADTVTLIAALEIYLQAILTESTYSTLQTLDVTCATTMST